MSNQDWEEFGEKLRKTIMDVAENGTTYTVNQVADWIDKNLGKQAAEWKNAAEQWSSAGRANASGQQSAPGRQSASGYQSASGRQNVSGFQEASVSANEVILYKKRPESRLVAILLAVLGYGLGAVVVIWASLILLGSALLNQMGIGLGVSVFNLLLLVGCGAMAYKGTTTLTRLGRFKDYVQEIGTDEYCTIERLAKRVGKKGKFVVKDIERMITKGWFRQGHLDKQKTCLMVTNQMYTQYRQLEMQREQHLQNEAELQEKKRREEEALRAEQKQSGQKRADSYQDKYQGKSGHAGANSGASGKGLSPEMEKIIQQGDAYVRKIRACNDAIPGEVISAKISRMEELVDKIFDRVEQNPASVSDIRRLMEYYLPTTIKLLETYAEMDAQSVGGENIQTAKREIEETLDTINSAFEKLLDSLFQEAAWDVSSDISVLKTMLAQEGLGEDGLKR